VVVAIATGVVFGLIPACQTTRVEFLKSTVRLSSAKRAGRVMVVAELTLSVMLLATAFLLLESFWQLQRIHPGFRADHLLTASVWLAKAKYGGPDTTRFYEDVVGRVGRLPGVRSLGAVSYRPFLGMAAGIRVDIDGANGRTASEGASVGYDVVTPGYLSVIE